MNANNDVSQADLDYYPGSLFMVEAASILANYESSKDKASHELYVIDSRGKILL